MPLEYILLLNLLRSSDILVLSNLRPAYKVERKESVSAHLRDP